MWNFNNIVICQLNWGVQKEETNKCNLNLKIPIKSTRKLKSKEIIDQNYKSKNTKNICQTCHSRNKTIVYCYNKLVQNKIKGLTHLSGVN